MRVWRDGSVVFDGWVTAPDDGPLPPGDVLVPPARVAEALARPHGATGLLLQPDDEPEAVAHGLARLALVAIVFPAVTDGRGYSLARQVRACGYRGELRALGAVRRDQALYLRRCGFTSFALEDGTDAADFARGFDDFSVAYQRAGAAGGPGSRPGYAA